MKRTEALIMRRRIEEAVQSLDKPAALDVVTLHPFWEEGMNCTLGLRVKYDNELYEVILAHTAQADWTPDVATSMFTKVNETNAGTINDPIPYDGNMVLTNGLYYIQDGITYLCNRDTGNAVHNALADLVGLYVEVA